MLVGPWRATEQQRELEAARVTIQYFTVSAKLLPTFDANPIMAARKKPLFTCPETVYETVPDTGSLKRPTPDG